jgi:hypothetical protein
MEEALPFQPRVKRNVSLKDALSEARSQAKQNGVSDMSLDEINSIIAEGKAAKAGKPI